MQHLAPQEPSAQEKDQLEEEDEEEEPPARPTPTPRYGGTGKRPLKRPMPVKAELAQLIRTRRNDVPLPPPPKPFNPAELRAIDNKASLAFSLNLPQLSRDFLQLKWAHLEDHILHCAAINMQFQTEYHAVISSLVALIEDQVLQSSEICRTLEDEYCRVAFRQVPDLTKDVSQIIREVTKLRLMASTVLVMHSQRVTQDLRNQLYQEFIRPRDIARHRIDGLLDYSTGLGLRYQILREKHQTAKQGLLEIRHDCRLLGPKFKRYCDKFEDYLQEFDHAGHFYRHAWFARQKRLDPLRAAEPWTITNSPAELPPADFEPIEAMLFDDKKYLPAKRKLEKRPLLHASRIRMMFMRKWKPGISAQSPELDLHWRQLDIMAPFFLQLKHYDILYNEARYLLGTFTGQVGPLWSNIEPERHEIHKSALFGFVARVRKSRYDLIAELEEYRFINWVRIGLEKELLDNNRQNEIQERGLFVVPRPLSENLPLFDDWTRKLTSAIHSSWIPRRALQVYRGPLSNGAVWERWLQILEDAERQQALDRRAETMNLGFVPVQRRGRIRPTVPAKNQQKASAAEKKPWPVDIKTNEDTAAANKPLKKQATPARDPKAAKKLREIRKMSLKDSENMTIEQLASRAEIRTHGGKQAKKQERKSARARRDSERKEVSKSVDETVRQHPDLKKKPEIPSPKSDHSAKAPSRVSSFFNSLDFFQQNSSKRKCSTLATTLGRAKDCSQPEAAIEQPSDLNLSATGTVSPLTEDASLPNGMTPTRFWNCSSQRGPNGQRPIVHYCRSLESTEEVAQLFLNSKVIGFDMEWKAQASASDTIQNNLSMIQIANEGRIGLFQIALFKPARTLDDFVAPSLKRILESEDVTKVGVSIKADATRLRKFLGIDTRSILELSHLFKLVKHGHTDPKLVNKRMVNLSEQMEEHFGLPLEKSEDVRCGDWARPLNYRQVQLLTDVLSKDAATDPYACICLFNIMEQKRVAMDPMPPRPAHAELNLPILLPREKITSDAEKEAIVDKPSDVDLNGHP
ncbi:hypothetical protein N7509_007635 [Penicillium cosmopolitanum]|uniref:3'-5' exonuclease domain-containing protein n=1 Tax=Penicillium cosmopolitanum TaxID=1131564 RepID=A0A9W9VZS5_9EURO|nr:uncharacterized protein N7509_007635 [Penicillium cosmopolitanum]KAJ5392145.1 hypothetical protein N7509_007635 [Penicillium cosmopolitanum]